MPRLVVNAKAYPQATGRDAILALARALDEACQEAGVHAALAPPMTELATLGRSDFRRLSILAQHTDPAGPGAATGWVTAQAVLQAGANGSLLNHAEHKVPHDRVAAAAQRLREQDLWTVVCADSLEEVDVLARLKPDALAIEPPQLIGGDVSVTTADPAIVSDAVARTALHAPTTKTLCGAGVKNGKDVAAALALGAYGVLVASGVVTAASPKDALLDLARGL